jgi:hypothetical protein
MDRYRYTDKQVDKKLQKEKIVAGVESYIE